MKQVVVGKLKPSESFGEISVIMKEPMTCSIVTENECKIGLIQCDQLHSKLNSLLFHSLDNFQNKFNLFSELEPITLRLLLQTDRTFADLTDKQIFEKYIEQQKKKEWKNFKAKVINDVFEKGGIVHGHGKYKMYHEKDDIEDKEQKNL